MKNNFTNIINIGNELANRLIGSGIISVEDLKQIGSKEAIIKVAANNYDVCINSLYALEGAIKGVRWHYLTKEEKQDLKEFFNESFK